MYFLLLFLALINTDWSWTPSPSATTDWTWVPNPPTPVPQPKSDSQLMLEAARKYNVLSVKTGDLNSALVSAAEQHARYMASVNVQGHQGWSSRAQHLAALLPDYYDFQEVAAESWDHNSREEAAPEMFNSWRQSPGHWGAVNGPCAAYGYSMARGRRVWYGCGIFAKKRH